MLDWPEIHNRRGFFLPAFLLAPISYMYGFAVWIRLLSFRNRDRRHLPGFVVSIGNITAGGTGKTPAACMLAQWALSEGYRVAVLSRGYGGSHKKGVLEVSDGVNIFSGPKEAGDEPYLLAKRLRGVPIIVARNRYEAGVMAHKKYESDFYILDDGFQHLELRRDLDLVLLDASNPFGNGHLLPWGPLREPVQELRRAGAIIFTRSGGNPEYGAYEMDMKSILKDMPVFHGQHIPENVVFPGSDKTHETEFLSKKRVVAFAGIARPDSFRRSLAELGAEVVFFKGFKDHHVYSQEELRSLNDKKNALGADYMITTEKDWVRIEKVRSRYKDLGFMRIGFTVFREREAFWGLIRQKVGNRQ